MKEQTTVCSFFLHPIFLTFFGYSFQASRFAQRLSTAIRGNENFVIGTTLLENQRFYSYYVIGKSKILFLLRNSYHVIRNVEDPRCLQPSSKGPSRCNRPTNASGPRNTCCPRDFFCNLVP